MRGSGDNVRGYLLDGSEDSGGNRAVVNLHVTVAEKERVSDV
jgi:hypothetical protein